MFHYFHDRIHNRTQGSLSGNEFDSMIQWLASKYKILDSNEFTQKFLSNSLKKNEICFSFDDALKCQVDIAVPILRNYGIKAFFFIHSSALENTNDFLEIFRLFRNSQFKNIDEFYKFFFKLIESKNEWLYNDTKKKFRSLNYLSSFPFYSENDRWFRYLRDHYLGSSKYISTMFELMSNTDFDIKKSQQKLYIQEDEVLSLHNEGHTIGLHSFSHPTQIDLLPSEEQFNEYEKNLHHLSEVLNTSDINSVSHPCGHYNKDTLSILEGLGIKIGFRSNMAIKEALSPLEVPREDSSNIYQRMSL
jgi:peptidoglycan/xylan/chitin deacetylase (PgdA/CDA1 family)